MHYDWLAAGEITQSTVARLSAELRRYLDDTAWLENRRIMEILHDIEHKALACREEPPNDPFIEIDDTAPSINLNLERPLFTPPMKSDIDDALSLGRADDVANDALFDSVHVDKNRLAGHIRQALQRQDQITLLDIVNTDPLEHGLSDLIAYHLFAKAALAEKLDSGPEVRTAYEVPSVTRVA